MTGSPDNTPPPKESLKEVAIEPTPNFSIAYGEDIPPRDPQLLNQFLQEPFEKIAAAMTGALSAGRTDAVLMGGRIVQAALKGRALQQVSREIRDLIKKGQIKEDYASSKNGFKSLEELLMFIDSEAPDEDRLKAVKAMFVAINSVGAKEGDQVLNYALLHLAKKLSASQLMLLKISYDLYKSGTLTTTNVTDFRRWSEIVAGNIGHGVLGLINQDSAALEGHGLLTPRTWGDGSGVNHTNARLTDLAVRFCQYVEKYGD
jgi:hypothetical protein